MARRHETAVPHYLQQGREVGGDAPLRIALCQVAEELRRDRTDVVVHITEIGDYPTQTSYAHATGTSVASMTAL
jgi:hypothetical protein